MGVERVHWYEGRWVLIVGETGRGKTRLTEKILLKMVEREEELAIFDFAPENIPGVGGKLKIAKFTSRMDDYSDIFLAPRLSGKNREEIHTLAEINGRKIERLLEIYRHHPCKVVVVNDVSIYLQSRTARDWVKSFEKVTETVLANGYYGYSLGKDDFSRRERQEMENLMEYQDLVIYL